MVVMGSITESTIEFRCCRKVEMDAESQKINVNVFKNNSYPDLISTRISL